MKTLRLWVLLLLVPSCLAGGVMLPVSGDYYTPTAPEGGAQGYGEYFAPTTFRLKRGKDRDIPQGFLPSCMTKISDFRKGC